MAGSTLPPFAALRAFEAVGRLGGFRKAAGALGISHAIVSRHVSGLERDLGLPLLDRRSGQLTAAGLAYHQQIAGAIAAMEAATNSIRAKRTDRLAIWCSAGFALHWLTRRLQDFASQHRRITIDLRSTDSEPALERGDADGDIRYLYDRPRPARSPDLSIWELARPNVYPVASAGFLSSLNIPISNAADLPNLPLIEEAGTTEWSSWLSAQGVDSIGLRPPVACYGQAHLALAAARAGQGITLTNDFLAAEDIANGRLVAIRPTQTPFAHAALGAYVFRTSRGRAQDGALLRFRKWLQAEIAREGGG